VFSALRALTALSRTGKHLDIEVIIAKEVSGLEVAVQDAVRMQVPHPPRRTQCLQGKPKIRSKEIRSTSCGEPWKTCYQYILHGEFGR